MRPRFIAMLTPWLGDLAAWIVPGYAFMLVLGTLCGAIVVVELARRAGFAKKDILAVLAVSYVFGLAGACAVPAAQAVAAWARGGVFASPTGMAAYGGLAGGTIGAIYMLRRLRLDALRFLDAGAPALGLGYFFARIGCFLAGCDYGAPTSSFVGTTFPARSHAFQDHVAQGLIAPGAHASLPVHPTELYSAAAGLFLFFVVSRLPIEKRGARFLAFAIGYGALRAMIETVRGDASRGSIGPLSTAQTFAFVTCALAIAGVAFARHRESGVAFARHRESGVAFARRDALTKERA